MKACPFCAEEIQDAAIVCRFCGADLVKNVPRVQATPQTVIVQQTAWNPGVAAVLSLVIPGAGQLYKGQVLNGLVWFAVVIIGYVMLIVPGLVLHLCCIIGAASGTPPMAQPAMSGLAAEKQPSAVDLAARKAGEAIAQRQRAAADDADRRIAEAKAAPPRPANYKPLIGVFIVFALMGAAALWVEGPGAFKEAFGSGASTTSPTPHPIAPLVNDVALTGNKAHDVIAQMGVLQRRIAFEKIFEGSAEKCGRVNRTFYQGSDKSNRSYWNVGCSDGHEYSIQIENNATGSSRITDCGALRVVANVRCFETFDAQRKK